LKTLCGIIHAVDDCTAYFACVLSYECKMFTNEGRSEGVTFINIIINLDILKTVHGRIHAVDDCTAYFASVVSYECKMFTNFTEGVTFINIIIN
jgi:hypothetical protein